MRLIRDVVRRHEDALESRLEEIARLVAENITKL